MKLPILYQREYIMRAIKIIEQNYGCHTIADEPEDSYIYEGNDSPYFSNHDESETVPITKKEFETLWEGLSTLDFNKILLEQNITGCDGWRKGISLQIGFHETNIMLWCPDISNYSESEQPESIKLLKLINKIEKLANKYNFELNPTGIHILPKIIPDIK